MDSSRHGLSIGAKLVPAREVEMHSIKCFCKKYNYISQYNSCIGIVLNLKTHKMFTFLVVVV